MFMGCLSWRFLCIRAEGGLCRRYCGGAVRLERSSPQANEELVESGLSGEPVRKSRLAGQPGVTE